VVATQHLNEGLMDLLKISDHMNHHPVTFTEEMSVEEAVNKLIIAEQLGGPVINKEKKVIGFISEQDCLPFTTICFGQRCDAD
jgi:CBS domain-containing protein